LTTLEHIAIPDESIYKFRSARPIRSIPIPSSLFDNTPRKLIKKYYQRIMEASPSNVLEFVHNARVASMACFVYMRS
ncbi:hypothetical protein, partial [Legionella bozemanae]|uniref:hypothetical protein n=1 Tax=Legionella bozemanae TaxID=447 RepID=UPI001B80E220